MFRSLLIPLRLDAGLTDHEIPTPALSELFRQHYGPYVANELLDARAILAASPFLSDPEDAQRHYRDLAQNGHHIRLPDSLRALLGDRTRGLVIAVPQDAPALELAGSYPHAGCLDWLTGAKLLMDQVLGPDHAVAIGYPMPIERAIVALTRTNHAGSFIESLPPTLRRGDLTLEVSTRESDHAPTRLTINAALYMGERQAHAWSAPQLPDEEHLEAAYALSLHAQAHGFAKATYRHLRLNRTAVPAEGAPEPAWVG